MEFSKIGHFLKSVLIVTNYVLNKGGDMLTFLQHVSVKVLLRHANFPKVFGHHTVTKKFKEICIWLRNFSHGMK